MKKSTHSKFKNTAILFELLTRQVASDTVRGVDSSPALQIIKNHFKSGSVLAKELTLYNTLLQEKFAHADRADYLVNTILKLRRKLDLTELKQQKYVLISEVKKHYDLVQFFKTPLTNYKLCASVYRVFEGASIAHAAEVVNSRFTIIEHLTRKSGVIAEAASPVEGYLKQDEDIRLLAYKLMLDKFNSKYAGLSVKQKSVLREYINNISNTTTLKSFVVREAQLLQERITTFIPKVKDKVVAIKLGEVSKLLSKYSKIKTIKESHVLSLLLYYELLKELKNAK